MPLKNTYKTGGFLCSHFNIEDGRKRAVFLAYYTLFKKGKNATEMRKKICAVYGEGAVTNQMCQKWFSKFRAGSLDNAPWLGRPVEVDRDQIKTLIENNQCSTMWEIADILKTSK